MRGVAAPCMRREEGLSFCCNLFSFGGVAALQGVAAAVDADRIGSDDESMRIDGKGGFFDNRIFFGVYYDQKGLLLFGIETSTWKVWVDGLIVG